MKRIKNFILIILTVALALPCGAAYANKNVINKTNEPSLSSNEISDILLPTETTKSFPAANVSKNNSDEGPSELETIIENTAAETTTEKNIDINERLGNVTPIAVNSFYTGVIETAGTINLYEFSVPARCGLSVEFTHERNEQSNLTGWVIYLFEKFDPSGADGIARYRMLNKYETTTKDMNLVTSASGVYGGNYVLAITGKDSRLPTNEYMFKVIADYGNIYEAEPNDSKNFYTQIRTDVKVIGLSNHKELLDNDWYMFTLPETGTVNVKFSHGRADLPQVCWLLGLYGENDECYWYTTSTGIDNEITSGEIGLPAGNYFVKISTYLRNDTQYTLTVATGDVSEIEFNDTKETAQRLEFSNLTSIMTGSITERQGKYDVDWFTFESANDGVFVLTFNHKAFQKTNGGWQITVYNEQDEIVYYDVSLWNEATKVAPLMGINAGKYYIKVDSEGMRYNNANYALKLAFVETDAWETEGNNSFETADEIFLNSQISGTLVNNKLDYDRDCYFIDIEERTFAYLTFSHANLADNKEGWIVTIQDENGDVLEEFTSRWVDSKLTSTVLEFMPGRYYITVDTALYFSNKKYTIKLETQS